MPDTGYTIFESFRSRTSGTLTEAAFTLNNPVINFIKTDTQKISAWIFLVEKFRCDFNIK